MHIDHSYDPEFETLINGLPDSYRELDGIGSQLDINASSSAFFNSQGATTADVSIDENANVSGKDVITYNYEIGKPLMRLNSYNNLWKTLKKLYGKETADQAITSQVYGDIYINDSWDIGRPYCFNFSTLDIALEGLKMSKRLKVEPPKGLASFLRQVEQFVVYAANSCLGATGLADLLLTVSIYYQHILKTGNDHTLDLMGEYVIDQERAQTYLREQLTSLIYTLNWEFRGHQSPFTNVSVYDRFFLEELLPSYALPGAEPPKVSTVEDVQQIFLECMNDAIERTQVTFPIITAAFSTEEGNIKDTEFLEGIMVENAKFGFINFYHGATSTLSSCCRLRSDAKSMGYVNSFGAGGTKIGSLGVVTINLPKVFHPATERIWLRLKELIGLAVKINHAKRVFINARVEDFKALPLYSLGHMSLDQQYSTIGFIGLYEASTQTTGCLGTTREILARSKEILSFMSAQVDQHAADMGIPHNIEQIPGEGSAVKLVKKDLLSGIAYGVSFYSNQFIPLQSEVDPMERIKVQGKLDPYCSGGSIMHLNVTNPLINIDAAMEFVKHVASMGVVYWAINHVMHVCPNCGDTETSGNFTVVCECGSEMEQYTRVVGFLTKKKHWGEVRRENDFNQRKFK